MEGSVLGRWSSLEVQRDFAGSRLEERILIRVFELITPAIRALAWPTITARTVFKIGHHFLLFDCILLSVAWPSSAGVSVR
jgi:hypothetical protein